MKFVVSSASGCLTHYNLPYIGEIDTSRNRLGDIYFGSYKDERTIAEINTLEELLEFLDATPHDIVIEKCLPKDKPPYYEITIYDDYIK